VGVRTAVRITSTPSERKAWSKPRRTSCRDRRSKPERLLVAEHHQVASLLPLFQPPLGFGVQARHSIRRVAGEMKNSM
jgi:hypothetical protein